MEPTFEPKFEVFPEGMVQAAGKYIMERGIVSLGGRPANFLPVGDGGLVAALEAGYEKSRGAQHRLPGFPKSWGAIPDAIRSAGKPFSFDAEKSFRDKSYGGVSGASVDHILRFQSVGFESRVAKFRSRAVGEVVEVPYLFPAGFARYLENEAGGFRRLTPVVDRAPVVLESVAMAYRWLLQLFHRDGPEGAKAAIEKADAIVDDLVGAMSGSEAKVVDQIAFGGPQVPEVDPRTWMSPYRKDENGATINATLAFGAVWWRLDAISSYLRLVGVDVGGGGFEDEAHFASTELGDVARCFGLHMAGDPSDKAEHARSASIVSAVRKLGAFRSAWASFLRGPGCFRILPDHLKPREEGSSDEP